jgi:N-acetylmuramoyl-L-alanine amidase
VTIAYMNPSEIEWLTLHCTATPEGRPNTAEEVTSWDIARFGQPSYHWVVELDGTVTQTLQENQRGAHVGGHNTGNLGVSYVGGTETLNAGGKPKDTRTDEQKAAMEATVRDIISRHPDITIRGHHDWPGVTKACPSFDVEEWLTEIGLEDHFG